MSLEGVLGWYQSRIGQYDKNSWESTIEQRILRGLSYTSRKTTKIKSELIDVDFVRGSAFPKAKPEYSLWLAGFHGITRLFLIPFYKKWWVKETSLLGYRCVLSLYFSVITCCTLMLYFKNQDVLSDIPVSEVLLPLVVMFLLSVIHSQIVCTRPNGYSRSYTLSSKKERLIPLLRVSRKSKHVRQSSPLGNRGKVLVKCQKCLSMSKRGTSALIKKNPIHCKGKSLSTACRSHSEEPYQEEIVKVKPRSSSENSISVGGDALAPRSISNSFDPDVFHSCSREISNNSTSTSSRSSDDRSPQDQINNCFHRMMKENKIQEECQSIEDNASRMQSDRNNHKNKCRTLVEPKNENPLVKVSLPIENQIAYNLENKILSESAIKDEIENIDANSKGKMFLPLENKTGVASIHECTNTISEKKSNNSDILFSKASPNQSVEPHSNSHSCSLSTPRETDGAASEAGEESCTGDTEGWRDSDIRDSDIWSSSSNALHCCSCGTTQTTSIKNQVSFTFEKHLFPGYQTGSCNSSAESDAEPHCKSPQFNHTKHSNYEWRTGITSNSDDLSYSSESEGGWEDNEDPALLKPEALDWHIQGSPAAIITSPHSTVSDRVSCKIWEGSDVSKVDLSVLDISSAVISKVDCVKHLTHYLQFGICMAVVIAFIPSLYRLSYSPSLVVFLDVIVSNGPEMWMSAVNNLISHFLSKLFESNFWAKYVILLSAINRVCLATGFFFLLSVAERAFKQRFLYAKHFCYLTSARRARKYELPHFRLNKVRNIKTWLSVRSCLKKRGPQRSVDVIVSAAFMITLILVSYLCYELLKDEENTHHSLYNCELFVWCFTISIYLIRFMTLGAMINKKYSNLSVLITEQINMYLHMEQKPQKKEELMLANNVLKLVSVLLKELESPFKISGISANPLLYNITRFVVLSACSGVLSDLLGFKLKLHKIKY